MLDTRIQEWEVRGFSWSHGYRDDGEAMTSVILTYASGAEVELGMRAADLVQFDMWLGESYARCQEVAAAVAVATLGTAGKPAEFVIERTLPLGEQVDVRLPIVTGARFDETADGSAVVVKFELGDQLDPTYAVFPIERVPLLREGLTKALAKFP